MLGKYSFKYIKKIDAPYIDIFFMLLVSIILSLKNGCVDLWGLVFYNKVLYVLCSVVGSFTVILFFKKISNKFDNIKINKLCFNVLTIVFHPIFNGYRYCCNS